MKTQTRKSSSSVFIPYDIVLHVDTEKDEGALAALCWSNIQVPLAVFKSTGRCEKEIQDLLHDIQQSLTNKCVDRVTYPHD